MEPPAATRPLKIAASILAADFGRLAEQVQAAAAGGVDYLHCDLMDGHFVPPITFGTMIIEAVHRATPTPLDIHLMVEEPERYIEPLAQAGASICTVHIEACRQIHRVVQQIKAAGMRAGVALNPGTPLAMVEEVLPLADLILVMSVNPGWGGQPFLPEVLPKLRRIRSLIDRLRLPVDVEIDGGITEHTIDVAIDAGANVLVAGSAIFNQRETIAAAVQRLRARTTPAAGSASLLDVPSDGGDI